MLGVLVGEGHGARFEKDAAVICSRSLHEAKRALTRVSLAVFFFVSAVCSLV